MVSFILVKKKSKNRARGLALILILSHAIAFFHFLQTHHSLDVVTGSWLESSQDSLKPYVAPSREPDIFSLNYGASASGEHQDCPFQNAIKPGVILSSQVVLQHRAITNFIAAQPLNRRQIFSAFPRFLLAKKNSPPIFV